MTQQDHRARLQPKNISKSEYILGPRDHANVLYPLYSTNGVLFPYTPAVTTGNSAEYEPSTFVHSNYTYHSYIRSTPKPISIAAKFTAQTTDEALYMLAVMHFFRSVTKSYFGVTPYERAGTPPPILKFSYLGEHQFNNVPVIVKSFDFTLEDGVDYVPVDTAEMVIGNGNKGIQLPINNGGGYTYVPALLSVAIELEVQQIPINVRNEFNLDKFRTGHLVGKGFI